MGTFLTSLDIHGFFDLTTVSRVAYASADFCGHVTGFILARGTLIFGRGILQ